MIETTLNGKTEDIAQNNIKQLKHLFPEIVTEDKIDFEKLREILGEEIADSNERYDFTWKGKHESMKIALNPSEGTLRPSKEDSKNWDSTENIYIEGDNLEVLKILQKSYYGKIKMIYLDPPYNTGKDFVYGDNFIDNLKNYLEQDEDGFNISSNPDTSGRYHTNWLNMMYPRLKLGRNLLREDGIVFISIDDNELNNLIKLCDEIFGEYNHIATLPTIMNLKGNNDQFGFAGTHEYIVVYGKNYDKTIISEFKLTDEEINEEHWLKDEKGYYKKGANLKATGIDAPREKRPNLFFPIYIEKNLKEQSKYKWSLEPFENSEKILPITDGVEVRWRWSKDRFKELKDDVIITKNGDSYSLYKKQRPSHSNIPTKKPKSVFYKPEYSSGNGNIALKKLFNDKVFDFPKPLKLIEDLTELGTTNEDIVLDFFSGSATTADAILNLNLKNKTNNKFILVQLPEKTNETSLAYKLSYRNICEIGEERIRRAGEMLLKENPDADIDIGFKVFKLDSSNLTKWNPDVDNLEQSLISARDNIVEGRTELDLVYEIMLKYGLELTLPVEEIKQDNYNFYSVGLGSLVICLDNHIKRDVAENIIQIKKELSPSVMRVVFKDNGFESDSDKTNVKEILRNNEIDEFITI